MKKNLFVCVFAWMSFSAFSNHDLPKSFRPLVLKDSIDPAMKAANREARKAMLFSAVVPGLGQAYNRKYWKIPLIYAAAGGFSYLALQNHKEYKVYSNALRWRYDNDSSTMDEFDFYTDDNLVQLKKQYKRRRDLCLIGVGAVYLFNVVDANVDAHLRKFDEQINEKLSLSVRPAANVLTTFDRPVYYSGVKLRLNF